jgi:hypothetical protein
MEILNATQSDLGRGVVPDARLERTRHAYHDAAQPDCTCPLCRQVVALETDPFLEVLAAQWRAFDLAMTARP